MTTKRVRIPLDDTQYGWFEKEAARFGLSISHWMRSVCIRSLVEGSKAEPTAPEPQTAPTPEAEPDPTSPITLTFDQRCAFEAQHYRRGVERGERDLIARLVREGRLVPTKV